MGQSGMTVVASLPANQSNQWRHGEHFYSSVLYAPFYSSVLYAP